MDFWKTILGLARRRYIGLPLLVVALGTAALAYFLVPAHYVSSTTMVLTTPTSGGTLSQDPTKPNGVTNPLLNFDEGLKTAATIVIHAMNTPEALDTLGAGSGSATSVTIDDGRTNPDLLGKEGPFVYIEGDSTSADDARNVVVRAQQFVRTELENRQKALGAPPITFITMVDVVPPSTPELRAGAKWQAAGIAAVLCIGIGLVGVYTWHRLTERRRAKPAPSPARQPARDVDPPTIRTHPVSLFEPNGAAPVPATNGSSGQSPSPSPRRWPKKLTRNGARNGIRVPEKPPATPVEPEPAD